MVSRHGGDGSTVGLDDLRDLFSLDSMIPSWAFKLGAGTELSTAAYKHTFALKLVKFSASLAKSAEQQPALC